MLPECITLNLIEVVMIALTTRRWLAVLGLVAGISLLGATVAAAQEATPEPEPVSVQDCAECHLDVVAEWQTSPHAQAYVAPGFQTKWQETGSDPMCLSCHTTGFVPRTGAYDHEGITCAACHGQTPANHPPEPVAIDPGVEVCADCHTTTFAEWQMSAHGEQQLACTSCHTPHNQGIRFETADALCLNCHDQTRDDYAHVTHLEQACVDCHWYKGFDETLHVMTGNLMPTGHDSVVETRTCLDCHASLDETVTVSTGAQHPLLDAQIRIGELEAEVQTVRAQGQNEAAVLLIQGLLVGAVLAAAVTLAFFGIRRFRGRHDA